MALFFAKIKNEVDSHYKQCFLTTAKGSHKLMVGGSIYDTVASREDIFLQETTAHDPTTDQRTKGLFCCLACSKLQNSENRENMNPNLKAPSLCTIPLILFPRVLF